MKKVLFFAAALCAVMFAVAGCEKNPGGNGNNGDGDNGGDGNDGGETVVAKPAKSFTVVDSDNLTFLEMSFTNDDKGRVVNADIKTRRSDDPENPNLDETHNINMEYGENSIKFVTDEDYLTEDYTLENGLPVRSIERMIADGHTIYTEYKYRYDESGHIVEIEECSDDEELSSKTVLEWKDGCIESIFIDYYDSSEEYVFSYNETPSTISNINPIANILINHFFSNIPYGESMNMYLFNILGKQSKYLPIRCEYRSELRDADPDDPESVSESTTKLEYELNDDKTVSKVKATLEEDGKTTERYYKFAY